MKELIKELGVALLFIMGLLFFSYIENTGVYMRNIFLILFALLSLTSLYMTHVNAFTLLYLIKRFLIGSLPVTLSLYLFSLFNYSTVEFPFGYLLLLNLLQLFAWYVIRKKYDPDKYETEVTRRSSIGQRFRTLILIYDAYISGLILGIIAFLRVLI